MEFSEQNNIVGHMEVSNRCNLLNTKRDGRMSSEFTSNYHVHIIVREGCMKFSDGIRGRLSRGIVGVSITLQP